MAVEDNQTNPVEILTRLSFAQIDEGAFEEAAKSAHQVWTDQSTRGGELEKGLEFLVEIAGALQDGGAPEDLWMPLVETALDSIGERRDIIWARLRLLLPVKMKRLSRGRINAGRWLGADSEAIRIVREHGTARDYARTLWVYDWQTRSETKQLIDLARSWTDRVAAGRALSVAAESLMYRHGAFRHACQILEEILALQLDQGSIVEQAKTLVRLTMAQLARGELVEAAETRQKAKDMVARLGPGYLIHEHAGTTRGGDLYPQISIESNFAWYTGGDWLAVAEHWVHAVSLEEPGGSPVHIVEAAMAAQAYALIGRHEDAQFYLDELTPILQQLQPTDWAFNGAVGRASHAIWDMASVKYARDYREMAHALLEAGVGDWTSTSLEQTVARMASLLNNVHEASEYFQLARAKLDPEQVPQRAIIDFDEAVSLRITSVEGDKRRVSLLDSALKDFKAVGMKGWTKRALAETQMLN
jgi:tetratricopeptide (TPR) repeat protein